MCSFLLRGGRADTCASTTHLPSGLIPPHTPTPAPTFTTVRAPQPSLPLPPPSGDWDKLIRNHTASDNWFELAKGGRARGRDGTIVSLNYMVGERRVCLETWAAFYGVPPSTASTIDRKLRTGEDVWRASLSKAESLAHRAEKGCLTVAATAWWETRLGYYEMIVDFGKIQHPRELNFSTMYADEFVPEMRLLGYDWKVPNVQCEECDDVDGEGAGVEDVSKGSRATWYKGRNRALQTLAERHIGAGAKPFAFKSAANHSAYKECSKCQSNRLSVQEAIQQKMSRDVIMKRKELQAAHLQVMYKQRACLERLLQLSQSQGWKIESADKCGDQSLHLPASPRVSSDNVSLYQYRVSLQANVYTGKLYNLTLLLPNLTTGTNFGLTTELCGLVRMIQIGEITSATRGFMRGVDGGSENVNHASLGMNSMLCGPKTRRFDIVQQNRLEPGHSHHYLTDGTFSVIEGWMTGPGFAGCATLVELITYLQKKFASSDAYKSKLVEITVLVVNFAFTKWFAGHLHMEKVTNIGDPLVWRHTWVEEEQRVRVQYKYLLSDGDSFEKEEWGPWVTRSVQVNDSSGKVIMQNVLRSDPAGVDLMASWPEIGDFPGVEEWKDEKAWKFWKVFDGLSKWHFAPGDKTSHTFWDGMRRWHCGLPKASDWTIGEPINISDAPLPTSPTLSWKDMWALIDLTSHTSAEPSSETQPNKAASNVLHPKKRVDRAGLSTSTDPLELNRVTHPGYSKVEQSKAIAGSHRLGEEYVQEHVNVKGSLFFIELGHKEGEFAIGIGRRTFAEESRESKDEDEEKTDEAYEIEWFERKGKRQSSWGQQPAFKHAVATFDKRRRPVYLTSVEDIGKFLPLAVETTKKSNEDEFTLTRRCMDALRTHMQKPDADREEETLQSSHEVDDDDGDFDDDDDDERNSDDDDDSSNDDDDSGGSDDDSDDDDNDGDSDSDDDGDGDDVGDGDGDGDDGDSADNHDDHGDHGKRKRKSARLT